MVFAATPRRVSRLIAPCALLVLLALTRASQAEEFRVTDAPIDTSNFDGFALLDDDLYYGVRVEEQDRSQLIHVDRDTGAWRVVAEVADDKAPLHIREVAVLGEAVYFVSAPLLKYFGTLWKYVPATGAVEALRQFDTLAPRELEVVGDKLILAAWAISKERSGIWRSDGTAAGTVQLGTGFVPENLTTAEPYVYFTSLGTDLYRIGVNGGALKISSGINFRDSVNRRILKVALYNFRIYFLASNSATEMLELWSTDGSQRNTRQESFIAEKGALPKATPKSSPPLAGGGAAGAEPPFLGIIDDSLVFSVPDYPFFYFYRHNPDAPDGSNATLITETPITFLLPFDKGLILAGPVEVDRREVLFVGNDTISDINANLALGLVPGPLLSTRASAYFVDVSAVQTGGDPADFRFPLYRIRSGTGIPAQVDTGEALAGKILGAAAAVSDTVAYVYLLDPTGQEEVKLTQIEFTDDPIEGEGETEGVTEGSTEGEGEGGDVDPEVLRELAQRILDAFAALDKDMDGVLSLEEVVVSEIMLSPSQFDALDADAGSSLSREELVAAGAIAPMPGCGCLRDGAFTDWRLLLGDFVTAALSAVTLLMVSVLLKKS